MKKRVIVASLTLCLVVSIIIGIVSFNNYREYKSLNNSTYSALINSVYSYGFEAPENKIKAILNMIDSKNPDSRKGIETWINEITSDYSVAQNSAAIAEIYIAPTTSINDHSTRMYQFFGDLKSLLLDMIRTENDFERWTEVCIELNDLMQFIKSNLNKDDLKDKSIVNDHWHDILNQAKDKYRHTYIIQNMDL